MMTRLQRGTFMSALVIAFLATALVGHFAGRLMPAGGFFAVLGIALLLFVALGISLGAVHLLVRLAGFDMDAALQEATTQFPVVWIAGIIAFLNARRRKTKEPSP